METAHAPPPLNPPERLLMGPGPSNPDPRVLAAMGANPVGHLDPYFVELMDQTMGALRGVYRTENHHTLPISGTGSAGLEAIMLNLLEPGDSAVVAENLDLGSLRREKDDVSEVREGFECGIVLKGYNDVKVGDVIETYEMREKVRA